MLPEDTSMHESFRAAVIGLAAVATLACDPALEPRRNRLSELRQQATAGLGTFYGRVRERDPSQPCRRAPRTVAGIGVEVGTWDGSPSFYRDTVTHAAPNTLDDPRFQPIVSTTTDSEGRFQFVDLPRNLGYAFRVIPPRDSPWRVAYGETMYGIANGGDRPDFPTLCVPAR
jgi:hypothetical protein